MGYWKNNKKLIFWARLAFKIDKYNDFNYSGMEKMWN